MVFHCHRCGSALDEDAAFCPQCAAPQLRIAPPEETTEQAGEPVHTFTRDRRSIDWRSVIRLAIWTAIPVGLIAPFFFPMVIAGPVVLISLYQRRRPSSPLDGKAGFRIGGLMGVLAAYVSAFGVAVWQLFEHYSGRQESALDAVITLQLQQAAEATHRMAQANSLSAQQARALLDFFVSPDARVTYTLFNAAVMAFGIIVLAGLGGMLGARLSRRTASH